MNSKKKILTVFIVVMFVAVVAAGWIGLQTAPTVNHALHISRLLQPWLDGENQTVHIGVSAQINGKPLVMESDVSLVTEDDVSFLVVEQSGTAVYIAENVLFLENGKAFKITDKLQTQTISCQNLIPQIGMLYDTLKITPEDTERETVYSVTVTGQQMHTLLAAVSLGEALPLEGIEKLNVHLAERDGKLERIVFSGRGNWEKTAVSLEVTLSDFRKLSSGEYPIPMEVKESAKTVDPEELFSLSEDLYRLVLALVPLSDLESISGRLALTADCGMLQLDTEIKLSDFRTDSNGQIDTEALKALPEMVGVLCMEGDVCCVPKGDTYVYTLALDGQAMEKLSGMILPELEEYSGNLTEGRVDVVLENGGITSMKVSIVGKISAWIAQIPISVEAEFIFD